MISWHLLGIVQGKSSGVAIFREKMSEDLPGKNFPGGLFAGKCLGELSSGISEVDVRVPMQDYKSPRLTHHARTHANTHTRGKQTAFYRGYMQ